MLLFFSLTINSLYATVVPANPATAACLAEFKSAANQLLACGVGSSVKNYTLPRYRPAPPVLTSANVQKALEIYCTPGCAEASLAFSQAFTSPACLNATASLPMEISASDLSTLTRLGQELTCLKDGPNFCAVTLMNDLQLDPNVAISYPTINVNLNHPFPCSNCAKAGSAIVQSEVSNLSSPELINAYQQGAAVWAKAQQTCPASS